MQIDLDKVVSSIELRLPRALDPSEVGRVAALTQDAYDLIETAFLETGRDVESEIQARPWLPKIIDRVVREMVSAAVLVGGNAGVRSVLSTTGSETDQVTFADVNAVSWGGVRLTDLQRRELGIPLTTRPRGRFPRPIPWPEVPR